jgi:F-box-like/Leucine Rich repeat
MATATEREAARLTAALAEVLARAEAEAALTSGVLPPLPSDVLELIFCLLPVDVRLRCREVSRSWRAFLECTRLWRTLDMGPTSGVSHSTLSPALLRAASLRAGGQLRRLDLRGRRESALGGATILHSDAAIREVVRDNAGSLTELLLDDVKSDDNFWYSAAEIEGFIKDAPLLQHLQADVMTAPDTAARMLLNQPPFQYLRIHLLTLNCLDEQGELVEHGQSVAALLQAAESHTTLTGLYFDNFTLSVPELEAIVDVAVRLQWQYLGFGNCELTVEALPALTRLLASNSLRTFYQEMDTIFAGPHLPAFCNALRGSHLDRFFLRDTDLFEDLGGILPVLAACVGHPTLTHLGMRWVQIPEVERQQVAGNFLAMLLNAPSSLTSLDLQGTLLTDDGARPFFEALGRSSRLRGLNIRYSHLSANCMLDLVLPSVQANTSLASLDLFGCADCPEAVAALAIVKARAAAAVA